MLFSIVVSRLTSSSTSTNRTSIISFWMLDGFSWSSCTSHFSIWASTFPGADTINADQLAFFKT